MSDDDSNSSFWARANAPRNPAEAARRARMRPPEPASDIAAADPIDTVASLDAAAYAQHRDEIMASHGGPRRSSEWMGGVDLRQPRTGLTDDELAQLMPWRTIGTPPPQGRVINTETARSVAAQTSLAVPNRTTTDPGR